AQHLVKQLDHAAARAAVTAERAMLGTLGGGCQVPIGGYATVEGAMIHLMAIVASPDGSRIIRSTLSGTDAEAVGATVGRDLLDKGARAILEEVYAA
ncbi:MAG TPA: hydroxymethylbilane synthase, partial [Rhizomicrobium sp.]|nr:hydroxymethylbilane synthase [Rhizomicrobium sp.]